MLVLLLSGAFALCAVVYFKRVYFHPLSRYSGPWIGQFTSLWDAYGMSQHARTFRHHHVLQKHGSGVRIGTDHVIFSDLQSWADIYGPSSSPCLKDPGVYAGFSVLGRPNILSATDRGVHGCLRRLFAHSFSVRGLADAETFIARKVDQYIAHTLGGKDGKTVDILPTTYELYLDIISWLSLGKSFDCLNGNMPNAPGDVAAYFFIVPLLAFAPFLRYAPIPKIRKGLAGLQRLIDFCSLHVGNYLEAAEPEDDDGGSHTDGTLLGKLTKAVDPETGFTLSRQDLEEHAILFLAAGSGTTAATLLFLLWECGRNEEYRDRLAREIREAFPDRAEVPTYDTASKLVCFPDRLFFFFLLCTAFR